VSTGLIVHQSAEARHLLKRRVGTLVLDESHKARRKGQLGASVAPVNNLLAFMQQMARNARHVILGTATPIQTQVLELWDLLGILNQGAEHVMGRDSASRWRFWDETHPLITGQTSPPTEADAWDLLRAPLPARETPMLDSEALQLVSAVRKDLNLSDTQFQVVEPVTSLSPFTRRDVQDTVGSDFFRRNNPFVRHVVLRKRRALEDLGLLERIAVDVHPQPDARPGLYAGVTFEGRGLMTNHAFRVAYQEAERFIELLKLRTASAGLLRSIFCSAFAPH